MAVSAGQVSVGTSATEIFAASEGTRVWITNAGGTSVFLGPSGVTTGNGYELGSGDTRIELVLEAGESVYGIVAAGTETVHYLST